MRQLKFLKAIYPYIFPPVVAGNRTEIIDRIERLNTGTFSVAFCGSFKSGKSSLINALLGEKLLPTKSTSATGVVTKIHYARHFEAFAIEDIEGNGVLSERMISRDEARDMIMIGGKDLDGITASRAEAVCIGMPHPLLKRGLVLIDTPGLEDDARLTSITMKEIQHADLAVIVFRADGFMSGLEKEMYPLACRVLGGNVVAVVNRIDCVSDRAGMEELRTSASVHMKVLGNALTGGPRTFFTSAAPSRLELDGFDEWLRRFAGCRWHDPIFRCFVLKRTRLVPRISAIAALYRTTCSELTQHNTCLTSRLQDMEKTSDEIIQGKRRDLNQRIESIKADVNAMRGTVLSSLNSSAEDSLRTGLESLKTGDWVQAYQASSVTVTSGWIRGSFKGYQSWLESKGRWIPVKVPPCGDIRLEVAAFPPAVPYWRGLLGTLGDLWNGIDRKAMARDACVGLTVALVRESVVPSMVQMVDRMFCNYMDSIELYGRNVTITSGLETDIRAIRIEIARSEECQRFCHDQSGLIENAVLEICTA